MFCNSVYGVNTVDTVNTVATGVQVAQAVMKGDVTSLQGIATSLGAQITGLDSVVTAYTSLPVVRTIVGVGLLVVQDPVTGLVTITNTTGPLMAEKPQAPVNPTDKGGGGKTLKDTYSGEDSGGGGGGSGGGGNPDPPPPPGGGGSTGETSGGLPEPSDPPIGPAPPIDPVNFQDSGRIGGGGGGGLAPICLNGVPPIFRNRDQHGEWTTFVDSWGRRWSEDIQTEVIADGVTRFILEYDENGIPITTPGHLDIILRRDDENRVSSALLTHDRHLQHGYINQGGILAEHPTTVPNLAMIYQAYEQYILPYVESCNYINVGTGLVKTGSTLSLNEDLSTFAKTSSLKSLAFKDTLSWSDITLKPTLGTLSTKNSIDWNGSDIINKPADLTTKTYVDGLSYISAGAGLAMTGNTLSINGSQITTLGTLTDLTVDGTITATSTSSSGVAQAYPPDSMTGPTTTITGQAYGNGVYKSSESSGLHNTSQSTMVEAKGLEGDDKEEAVNFS
ncbi:hypothetical protein HDU85_001025, partial [Gaertneriomyces sp. JEL0708]